MLRSVAPSHRRVHSRWWKNTFQHFLKSNRWSCPVKCYMGTATFQAGFRKEKKAWRSCWASGIIANVSFGKNSDKNVNPFPDSIYLPRTHNKLTINTGELSLIKRSPTLCVCSPPAPLQSQPFYMGRPACWENSNDSGACHSRATHPS